MSATPILRLVLLAMQKHGLEAILIGNTDADFTLRETTANKKKLQAVAKECSAAVWKSWNTKPPFFRFSPLEEFKSVTPCPKPMSARPTRKPRSDRQATLDALKSESDHHLTDLIRRRLAMPVEKRMNFLRKRPPGGGSCL